MFFTFVIDFFLSDYVKTRGIETMEIWKHNKTFFSYSREVLNERTLVLVWFNNTSSAQALATTEEKLNKTKYEDTQ